MLLTQSLAPVAVVETSVEVWWEPFSCSRTCWRRRSVLESRVDAWCRPAVFSWDILLEVSARPIGESEWDDGALNEDLRAPRPPTDEDDESWNRNLPLWWWPAVASWDMLRDIRLPSAVGDDRDEDSDSRVMFSSSRAWRRSRSRIALMCSPLRRRGWASWSKRVIEKARPGVLGV